MVYCSVLGCKSHSQYFNRYGKSITFHKFPGNTNIRKTWIQFTGRQDWEPPKDARICSKHFNDSLFRKGGLYDMAVPTLFTHKPPEDCEEQPTQIRELYAFPTAMNEEEVWSVQRLEMFASAYVQHEILYIKPSQITSRKTYKYIDEPQYHQQLNKEFAFERLAGALGLPNDHALHERCREFRFQLLCYVRGRVRSCASRGEHYSAALADAPARIAELAKRLNVFTVAVQTELSIRGSPMARWGVNTLVQALSHAARLYCKKPGAELDGLCPSALAAASAAVFQNATPVPKDLWCRLYTLRKRQLLKLFLAGDREEGLRPEERLRPADWHLADTLLLHGGDDGVLDAEMFTWAGPLRALVVLVALLAAPELRAAARAPPAPGRPAERRLAFWRAVHAAYFATGRRATVVALQRRWQRLLHLARDSPQPHHPLLVLVAVSFPRLMLRAGHTWPELVHHGLVVTTQDVAIHDATPDPPLNINFKYLDRIENCKSLESLMHFIVNKIQYDHNMYFNGVMWTRNDNNDTELVNSDTNSDFNECIDVKVTESFPSVTKSEEAAVESPINIDQTVNIEIDSEVVEDVSDDLFKPTINCPINADNQTDTFTTFDYFADILMKEKSLKSWESMDDIEKTMDDLEYLKTFKIVRVSNGNKQPIRYVDDDGITFNVSTAKSGRLIFTSALDVALDPKLISLPQVKLERIEETQDFPRKIARLSIEIIDNYQQPTPSVESYGVTYISDSSESDHEFDADKYTRVWDPNAPNAKSKRMSKRFWRNPENRRLLRMCKPLAVRLERLRGWRGRVVKRVELADIDEVRRINKNILTAQVEPTCVQQKHATSLLYQALNRERGELLRELMVTSLVDDVTRLDEEMQHLFAKAGKKIGDMIMASIYDEDAQEEGRSHYSRRCVDWLRRRERAEAAPEPPPPAPPAPPAPPPPPPPPQERPPKGPKQPAGRVHDDLDDLLRCTIIKKPEMYASAPETDSSTQPFFVGSDEDLVAGASGSDATPVITGVCSLAAAVTNPMTNMTNPKTNMTNRTTNMTNPMTNMTNTTNVTRATTNAHRRICYKAIHRKKMTNMTNPKIDATNPTTNTHHGIKPGYDFNIPTINVNDAYNGVKSRTNVNNPTMTDHTTQITNPSSSEHVDALQEAVRRLNSAQSTGGPSQGPQLIVTPMVTDGGAAGGGVVTGRGRVVANNFTVRSGGAMKNNVDTSRNPQYNVSQPLTPVIMKNSHASTITLAPTATTDTPALACAPSVQYVVVTPQLGNVAFAMTSPPTAQGAVLYPTLSLVNGQVVMTPQVTPVGMSGVSQVTPVGSSLMPVTVVPDVPQGLIQMSANVNVIGMRENQDAAVQLDALRVADEWVEPGRIQPPSALTFNDFITPVEYIANFGPDLTVLKLDSAKPLWTVAGEYMILAEKNLPAREASYWTLGSPKTCTQLIWPSKATASGPGIVIGDVVGNYQGGRPMVEDAVTVIDSDSDGEVQSEGGQTQSTLKVRSFAKCDRMDSDVIQEHPDVIKQIDRCYKKMTDQPVCYTLMLSIVSSTEQCDGLLRERAALQVWHRATGALGPLDVSSPREVLPPGVREALMVRHPDPRFLNDMAGKFQHLNSENALVRDNQVYVFAPNVGTLLVAPSDVIG